MKKLTLKEVFMKEINFSSPVQELEKFTRRNVDSLESVKELAKQYELFDDVLEFVATETSEKQSPEEKKYRQNPEVNPFFKHLLSKAKQALRKGTADYNELPGIEEYKDMLADFYKETSDKQLVHTPMNDYIPGMSPEKQARFAQAISSGEYGKLD